MQQCGFCTMLSDFVRRALCVGSRRGSTESYYRELGDQDTLKIDDKASELSDDSDVEELQHEPASSVFELDLAALPNLPPGQFLTMHKRRKKRLVTQCLRTEGALLDDLFHGQVQCILDLSVQWRFNAFALENVSGGHGLPVLCAHLFQSYGLMSHFKLDVMKTWKLFSIIEDGYHSSNPYHNSIHAADVTQAMHCFLQQKEIRANMEPLEVLASLLAAIAHDMDHPGVNQPFLIATSNHLAALYNNTSVLENHHWRAAISCIMESGFLDDMKEERPFLERQISSLILATDITKQQDYLTRFKGHLDKDSLDLTLTEHRHLVLQIALKCADISNPCRPWDISRKWSLRVCEEFFRQGDYERSLSLPITTLCDRRSVSIPQIQTGFFKFIVTPLITEWHRFLQNDLSTQMLRNLIFNHGKWETLLAHELDAKAGKTVVPDNIDEEDLEIFSGNNIYDSAEQLLPLRRSSLKPIKQSGFKEQIRRFSMPLNVFQEVIIKNKDKAKPSTSGEQTSQSDSQSAGGSVRSVKSQASVRAQSQLPETVEIAEKVLSSDNIVPEPSIVFITTSVQASRLRTVMKDGTEWKLVRQQTFPPLDSDRNSFLDGAHCSKHPKGLQRYRSESGLKFDSKRDMFCGLFKRNDSDRGDGGHAPSHLRDNMTSVELGAAFSSDQLQRRRKSMPAEIVTLMPRETRVRELTSMLPQFLRRTLSGKECWMRRRGSAPAVASDTRGLVSVASLRATANGARRKAVPGPSWIARASHSQEGAREQPRRGSLPAEASSSDDEDDTAEEEEVK